MGRTKARAYRKQCQDCLAVFESRGGRGSCPECSSDSWNFVDDEGRLRIPVVEAMAAKRYPNDPPVSPRRESWIKRALDRWHPEVTSNVS